MTISSAVASNSDGVSHDTYGCCDGDDTTFSLTGMLDATANLTFQAISITLMGIIYRVVHQFVPIVV